MVHESLIQKLIEEKKIYKSNTNNGGLKAWERAMDCVTSNNESEVRRNFENAGFTSSELVTIIELTETPEEKEARKDDIVLNTFK